MQIIKTTMIAVLAVIATVGLLNQTASATSDDDDSTPEFKVKVILTDVDSQTGPITIVVTTDDDTRTEEQVDPFANGEAGNVNLGIIGVKSDIEVNESFEVCAFSVNHAGLYQCKTAINTRASPDVVYIQAPSGIDRVPEGSTVYSPGVFRYYDDDGNVIANSYVKQGDDSENTETNKDQDAGVNVSFGDDRYNNEVNIDQRSTFADVIRDLVPIAKEGAYMAKDTAAQLLN